MTCSQSKNGDGYCDTPHPQPDLQQQGPGSEIAQKIPIYVPSATAANVQVTSVLADQATAAVVDSPHWKLPS